jgi:hypothetical protein
MSNSNKLEAKELAKRAIELILKNPERSLGIGTLNSTQQANLEVAIDAEINDDKYTKEQKQTLLSFVNGELCSHEPFAIKNLENIQGNNWDNVLISIGYCKDEDGRLLMNFGPVNKAYGARRLNVLATRAKHSCEIFSTIRAGDIDTTKTKSEGVRFLKDWLAHAEGISDIATQEKIEAKECTSEFQRAVARDIERRTGFRTDLEVPCKKWSIDIGVIDPELPGKYICGIEADGATYHSSPSARDNDRLRQELLESRGWKILRILSTDFFHNKENAMEKLVDKIQQIRAKRVENTQDLDIIR